ncbi:glycosyltransferase [Paenibacillus enshidis]|uniref:Glycosyltransferase n=1 Tax=Paenibacillus enshidis TaxID=1458439 RepID=A0ABV5AZM9_9BACL
MVELVLSLNDRDGKYAKHAAVVLASVFSNIKQTINVHILHDETLTKESIVKLTKLARAFHHYIFFYHVTVPEDMLQASAEVHKINHWTKASMYRLLLPNILRTDRVIYLDCDVWVNMDISELWNIDLGECYLGAIIDQGKDSLGDYFLTMGLNGDVYFNSGVILFHLDNIRKKETWYDELLHFLRNYPATTMPDQDALNFMYSSNYMQLDLRFNTFAYEGLDPDNKIVHFAGEDNKWWEDHSPAAPIYHSFLAMTPWGGATAPAPAAHPRKKSAAAKHPVNARHERPASEARPVRSHPERPASETRPVRSHPERPAPEARPVRSHPERPAPEARPVRSHPERPAPEARPVRSHPERPASETHPARTHPERPASETRPARNHPERPAPETRPVKIRPERPAPAAQPVAKQPQGNPLPPTPPRSLPQIPAAPVRRKRRRSLRQRLRPSLRKRIITRRKSRFIRKVGRSKHQHLLRRKALRPAVKKSPIVVKKIIYVIRERPFFRARR